MIKRLDSYIGIKKDEKHPGKTKRWWIYSKPDGDILGQVKWYGGWRKYVYYNNTVGYSDWDFMRMIADFCEEQTLKHYGKI